MEQGLEDSLTSMLDKLFAQGATFWWRDDDAAEPSPALDRLLEISRSRSFPCALSVIPAATGPALAKRLENHPEISVIQHGYAHTDHAPKGAGSWELGAHRPVEEVLAELDQGRRILRELFGSRFVPALVPPWNNIAPELLPKLHDKGFLGLSADADAPPPPTPGLIHAHAHSDLLRWKKGPARFAGERKAVNPIVEELQRQSTGAHPGPVGILTHHLEMDEAAWSFLESLLDVLNSHPAARSVSAASIWQENS